MLGNIRIPENEHCGRDVSQHFENLEFRGVQKFDSENLNTCAVGNLTICEIEHGYSCENIFFEDLTANAIIFLAMDHEPGATSLEA